MKKLSILGAMMLLFATLGVTMAQTAQSVSLPMKAVEGSKVTGTAVLTDKGTTVLVSVKLSGFDPNSAHAGHIHEGTCEAQGKVDFLLTPIKADASGNGSAETNVEKITYKDLTTGKYYVQYHVSDNPPGKQVSCANIVVAGGGGQGGGDTTGGGSTTTPVGAPQTGEGGLNAGQNGLPTGFLLAGLALLLVTTGTAYGVARNRNK